MSEVKSEVKSEVNIFGEASVQDWVLATLLVYAGHPVVKAVSSSSNECTWTFKKVPAEDLKIYEAESTNPSTSVILQEFIAAQKTVQHVAARARHNLGVWTGEQYRR
jgi:hypothetical protein